MAVVQCHGSKLYYGVSAADDDTLVSGVDEINMPDISVEDIPTTGLDDDWNTHEAGAIEPGEVSVVAKFAASQSAALYALLGVDGYLWKVVFSNGSYWEYTGYVSGFGTSPLNRKGYITDTIKFKVSGQPTFTASGGSEDA